jgi:hypothetical protein
LSIRDRLGSGAEDAIRNGSIPEDMVASSATGVCLYPPHRAALSREGRFHDIRCLRNGQWITTAIFDDLPPKLAAWLNTRSHLSWKIRSADTFQALEANKRSLRDNFVNDIRRDVACYDRVIFPCCFNRHWVILVTSKTTEEGTLASYNSTEVLSLDGAKRILLNALTSSPPAGPNLTTRWRCAALPSVQQTNWTDCGVYALFNIIRLKYIVEHRSVPRLPEVVILRKRLAALLGTPLTDRVWT